MKAKGFIIFLVFFMAFYNLASVSLGELPSIPNQRVDDATKVMVQESYGNLPLSFIRNDSQMDKRVRFYEKGSGHTFFFTKDGVSLVLVSGQLNPDSKSVIEEHKSEIISLTFSGANKNPEITPDGLQDGKVHYFIGNDPNRWETNIPTYKAVLYKNVYKGVDIRFYGNNRQLEYDIIVQPNIDPEKVKLSYNGIEGLKVTDEGDLEITLKQGRLIQKRPYIYQEIEGKRVEIEGRFKVQKDVIVSDPPKAGERDNLKDEIASATARNDMNRKHTYGFKVASYDKRYPLIIDPVLIYSTYLGGGDTDKGNDIAVDTSGNAYITGYAGYNFPTQNPIQAALAGYTDAFVTKLSSDGSLVYSTYLGGGDEDYGYGIAVDSSGNAYITGYTRSSDFPTQNPIQAANANVRYYDAFVTKLNSDGSSLTYSTYLGGSSYDLAYDIAVDTSGNAYITGNTSSTEFPTSSPIQAANAGNGDAFVTKINASGSSLTYSTYLGGSGGDDAMRIAVDTSGNAYITGNTYSTDFPTSSPIQAAHAGGDYDAFVTRLNPGGSSLTYSTYLGGSNEDFAVSIAVDTSGNAYITGQTNSANFPTSSPIQAAFAGYHDAFVTKLNPDGSSLTYSTYLGGSDSDNAKSIAVDTSGNAYITGRTYSYNFPTQNPIQAAHAGGNSDAFVTKINASGSSLTYSTYMGGNGYDSAFGIAVDTSGNAYITGQTNSTNFPTSSPIQAANAGNSDAFVVKIGGTTDDLPASPPTGLTATAGNGVVNLNWNDNEEIDLLGYNIYRSLTSGSGYEKINDEVVTNSQYQDTGLTNGVTYYYVVTAVDTAYNESGYSNEVSATPSSGDLPPSQPTGLIATAGNGVVNLNWNDNVESDLAGYNVYRSTISGGSYSKINTSLLTSSQYTDSGLTNGTTYYYVVTAVDTAGNESGYSSQVSATPNSNPPTASASATPTSGTAPLTVSFTGTGTDDGSITKYEWDFDGNGVYDWSSTTGGNTTKVYSSAGTWAATLRVTDNDGLTSTASVTITVSSPPQAPTAALSGSPTSGTAPLRVTFTYSGTDSDGSITKYEIDFDGNGVYDYTSTSSGTKDWAYGAAGNYTTILQVTDNDGLSDITTVIISVETSAGNPLIADANCNPISVTVGESVTLTGSAIGGSGSYIAYIWDYEGDGEYDWASTTTGTTSYIYNTAGSYSPTVMVVDSNGLTDTDSASLTVSSPSTLKVWISQPKNGDKVWGTDVTLHANTAPGDLTNSVQFQYKETDSEEWTWTDIGNEIVPTPNSIFTVTWDVTGLTEGEYQLRAVGKDTSGNTVSSEIITVTVTQTDPDIVDGVDSNGNRQRTQKISKDETVESKLEDYTSVEIPYGTLTQDATLTVTVLTTNPKNTTEGANASLDKFREIGLEDNPTLQKSVTVIVPYADTDNDGIVDGTNIPEEDLNLWWYNTETGEWEKIPDTEIDTTKKQVKAKMGHLSDFAIGSGDTIAPSAPSGLSATAGDGQVSLSWANPTDTDFAGVKVIRKTGGYSSSVTDGTEIYSGTGTDKTDTGLTNGTTYYYSVFTYDEVPNYSSAGKTSAAPQAASTGGGGGGGGGCFIATAAYGSPAANEVVWLSRFRDEYLVTNTFGRRLVSVYYHYGPDCARWISDNRLLKSVVRNGLKPLVWLSKYLVQDGKEYKN